MSKNVKSQFHYCVNENFKENIDKHSYKKQNGSDMDAKIFSYTAKFNLLDVARNFSNYLKENFTEVKFIKDIKPEMVQKFLDIKAEACTQNTIKTYFQALCKLELLAEKTFKLKDLQWKEKCIIPKAEKEKCNNRGVNSVISETDLKKIIDYATENRSQGGDAIRLQAFLGIRVQEIVGIKKQDIDLEKNVVVIKNTKGGKELLRKLTKEEMGIVKEVLEKKYDKDRLLSIKSESVNDYLRTIEDKMNLDRHSFHDIRRYVAQKKYDNCRQNGDSKEEAIRKTSFFLNHGCNRKVMLRECYIRIH